MGTKSSTLVKQARASFSTVHDLLKASRRLLPRDEQKKAKTHVRESAVQALVDARKVEDDSENGEVRILAEALEEIVEDEATDTNGKVPYVPDQAAG
jgi:hypothetical protein